jgi:hypothetical protein
MEGESVECGHLFGEARGGGVGKSDLVTGPWLAQGQDRCSLICITLASAQLDVALAKIRGVLCLQREQPDPLPKALEIAARGRIRRVVLKQRDHFLKIRFAAVENFWPGIEQREGDLLQLGLAGLAALLKCHVQSVLSNP